MLNIESLRIVNMTSGYSSHILFVIMSVYYRSPTGSMYAARSKHSCSARRKYSFES